MDEVLKARADPACSWEAGDKQILLKNSFPVRTYNSLDISIQYEEAAKVQVSTYASNHEPCYKSQ